MSEVEEYVKEWIKKGKPFRVPGFLHKRICERKHCSLEEAKKILDQIVAEDKSLRYIRVVSGLVGMFRPDDTRVAYHPYLEPDAVYRGRRRGRPLKRQLWKSFLGASRNHLVLCLRVRRLI